MATRLRLTRHGSKKKPFYWLVVANSTASRDGDFIEKLGTYNPLLSKDNAERIKFNKERIAYWLSVGATPSERSEKLFELNGIELPKKIQAIRNKKKKLHKDLAEKALAEKSKQDEAKTDLEEVTSKDTEGKEDINSSEK